MPPSYPRPARSPNGGDGAPLPDTGPLRAEQDPKARALAWNETGVRFESLALFAEPLFAFYDLDPEEAYDLPARPDEADEATVAVLEAARLLWAYLSLPEAERHTHRPTLAGYLLGPFPAPEDEVALETLLDQMEEQWAMLTPEDRRLAEDVEAETLGFDALLAHPAFRLDATPAARTYGPDRLGEMEAQALFAQPLLDAVEDPDALEAAMELASEYWTLAQLPEPERGQYLDALVAASDGEDREAFRTQAAQMVERFYRLFPEQQA